MRSVTTRVHDSTLSNHSFQWTEHDGQLGEKPRARQICKQQLLIRNQWLTQSVWSSRAAFSRHQRREPARLRDEAKLFWVCKAVLHFHSQPRAAAGCIIAVHCPRHQHRVNTAELNKSQKKKKKEKKQPDTVRETEQTSTQKRDWRIGLWRYNYCIWHMKFSNYLINGPNHDHK